jgi:hypothetical protein
VVIAAVTKYHSWGVAQRDALAIVVVVMALLIGFAMLAPRRGASGGVVNGVDNRWSTSKLSMFLWTFAILWAFTAVLVRYGGSAVPGSVPAEYFALLGIPAAGALGAKAITGSQADEGGKTSLAEPSGPVKGIGQIFSDDTGRLDLLDSQYFLFNLLLLGFFIAGFFHIDDPKAPSTTFDLPALPASLLALAGISTATYLGKKGLGDTVETKVPAGSSVTLQDESDLSLPAGATITLKSAGTLTIYPGVTYNSEQSGAIEAPTGGRLVLTSDSRVQLAQGATITGAAGSIIANVNAVKLLVSTGSGIKDAADADVENAGGAGTNIPAGGKVTLAPDASIVVMADGAQLELPAGANIAYEGAGVVTVLAKTLEGMLSAGATLGHNSIDNATFPDGADYVEAPTAGALQHAAPGGTVQLRVAAAGNPARSIAIAGDTKVKLTPDTTISFPAAPAAAAAGADATATTKTKLTLASGGKVTIKKSGSGVSAHAPAGSVVTVPADADAATITTTT